MGVRVYKKRIAIEPYRSKFSPACPLLARPVAYLAYHLVVGRLLGSGETGLWFGVYLRAVGL
jgi:hypothetical protein